MPINSTRSCLAISQQQEQQEQTDYVPSLETIPASCIDTHMIPDVNSVIAPTDVSQPIAQPDDADRHGIREYPLPQLLLHYY